MIKIENISKKFEDKIIFGNFSCEIPDTGITVLRGASGIGKTTLARIIAGLEKPDGGEITGLKDKKISFVFQEDRLFSHMTALENVQTVSDKTTAEKILTEFGLGEDLNKKPDELSGGMCRRVAIARALAYGGDLLILDEPFKGLDEKLKEKIFQKILDFSTGSAVLLITHDSIDYGKMKKIINLDKE
jgi:NitT/TauT family transport system ATP-binding protein